MNLLSFKKPSRYINNETNSVHKDAPVKVVLAFPDIYEIGMSHSGLKILYSIINNIPYASAERVFSPWFDFEEGLKKSGILLSSIESRRPLKDFDIAGFSLQYELSYTTVLNMLNLGGIPIRSEERLNTNIYPLVIAGGPCTTNPLPMSEFIDAFLIGDGEDAIREILEIYYEWKKDGLNNKNSLLIRLSEIQGMFVPSLNKDRIINRRYINSLDDAPFPVSPVVPFTNIVHDRINIEISRGCSMGCRFCQAGIIYGPVRERSPEKILELAEKSLKNTGYDSMSFTALNAGDYSCLSGLMQEFNRRFFKKKISMSLPSLRVSSVNSDILKVIKAVRKTGFTIAPEAGTDRLRAVINKDFTEEVYISAIETLFKHGWNNLKLYFMTGLPTETDADIAAIPEMVMQAIKISKKLTGKNINISVGISTFVPKSHTSFQWFGQNNINVLKEKNNFLKKAFLKIGVKYKGHDENMSLLEAVFARGDESLSVLIKNAWMLGCRLDAWTESFDFAKWQKAIEISKIDAFGFAAREYGKESYLPWRNIHTGINKEYLWKEYQNAFAGRFTKDCRKHCHKCGLKCETENNNKQHEAKWNSKTENQDILNKLSGFEQGESVRVRMQYSKTGRAKYLSHLELTTAVLRAMRRAEFPLKYSIGFHPLPKISFGPALRVGIAGLKEYLDVELLLPFETESALQNLNRTLPEGIYANRMEKLFGKEKSLNSFIIRYVYEIKFSNNSDIESFLEKKEVLMNRDNGVINIRKMVEDLVITDNKTVLLTLHDQGETKVRLDEICAEVFNAPAEELDIKRICMFGWNDGWAEPLEDEKKWIVRS